MATLDAKKPWNVRCRYARAVVGDAAEHACMELARQVGLTTVATELVVFDDIEVLVVEREFDDEHVDVRARRHVAVCR